MSKFRYETYLKFDFNILKEIFFLRIVTISFNIRLESDSLATNAFSHLVNLNSMASNVVSSAYQYIQTAPTFNFEQYTADIDYDLKLSNFYLGNVTDIGQQVCRECEQGLKCKHLPTWLQKGSINRFLSH